MQNDTVSDVEHRSKQAAGLSVDVETYIHQLLLGHDLERAVLEEVRSLDRTGGAERPARTAD
jgi:hypothetical protein